jgi:hypothetical protein
MLVPLTFGKRGAFALLSVLVPALSNQVEVARPPLIVSVYC